MQLQSYKHIPLLKAEKRMTHSEHLPLRVETINWTFATEKSIQNQNKVHYNIYHTNLVELLKWIKESTEVAEDVISIRPMKREKQKKRKNYKEL